VKSLSTLLLLVLLTATGCSTRPKLTVQSDQKLFGQTFTQVYATRSSDGDFDVVLLDNPLDDVDAGKAGAPLTAQAVRPLRHLVHIHVMYAPVVGARGDHAAATNAAINWYVWGDSAGTQTDLMHYGGTGFVKVYAGDDDTSFTVSNAQLKLKSQRGQMTDPLGTASLTGKFSAPLNTRRVKELLAELGADTDGPRMSRLEQAYPPARPVGP
jgi:hypothetical protein